MEGCGGGGGFAGDGKGTKQRATRDQLKLEKWHERESSRDVFIRAVVSDYKDSAPVTASGCQAGAFIHATLPYRSLLSSFLASLFILPWRGVVSERVDPAWG